ncbi:hypothetical protein LPJ71_002925 [Coemansia sp. S17]|nr:hypothetical protein LPJ71_002925 [Coemansia sp. S17]
MRLACKVLELAWGSMRKVLVQSCMEQELTCKELALMSVQKNKRPVRKHMKMELAQKHMELELLCKVPELELTRRRVELGPTHKRLAQTCKVRGQERKYKVQAREQMCKEQALELVQAHKELVGVARMEMGPIHKRLAQTCKVQGQRCKVPVPTCREQAREQRCKAQVLVLVRTHRELALPFDELGEG